jgi:hypothetical protein
MCPLTTHDRSPHIPCEIIQCIHVYILLSHMGGSTNESCIRDLSLCERDIACME